MSKPIGIEKRFLILCEGKDVCLFMDHFRHSDPLKEDARFCTDIQLYNFGGINELTQRIQILKNEANFDEVTHILVIRDAETNAIGAGQSIQHSFERNNLPVPAACCQWNTVGSPATAYVLLPSCSKTPVNGTLEDLCWDILADPEALNLKNDVQGFVKQMKEKYDRIHSKEHKSKLHTYFSINDKLVTLRIGEAAQHGAFDWNSEKLKLLKDIIQEGFR